MDIDEDERVREEVGWGCDAVMMIMGFISAARWWWSPEDGDDDGDVCRTPEHQTRIPYHPCLFLSTGGKRLHQMERYGRKFAVVNGTQLSKNDLDGCGLGLCLNFAGKAKLSQLKLIFVAYNSLFSVGNRPL